MNPVWQGQADDAQVEAAEAVGGGKEEAVTEEKEKKGERGANREAALKDKAFSDLPVSIHMYIYNYMYT